jgi:hypothetical protein
MRRSTTQQKDTLSSRKGVVHRYVIHSPNDIAFEYQYWAEAANYSAHTQNHTPSDNKETLLYLWTGSRTTVDHLHAYGE